MRLWTIHPQYLDAKGLVALWRESLLAQRVLQGRTRGYTNHPQLDRFKSLLDPVKGIGCYLNSIHSEALERGYNFNHKLIVCPNIETESFSTFGQLLYEFEHLLKKVQIRDPKTYDRIKEEKSVIAHPMFSISSDTRIESWEKLP